MEIRRIIEFSVRFRLIGRADEDLDTKARKEISIIKDVLQKEFYQVNLEDIGYQVLLEDENRKQLQVRNGTPQTPGYNNFIGRKKKKHR